MSIIVTQNVSCNIESNAFLKSTKHIQSCCSCLRALCLSILRFIIWSLCPSSLSESLLFVCNFSYCFHSYPFQCDPKKDVACTWEKSNCSVICTLFKITCFGKCDERWERPFLWPLTSFPDHHTYSVHSVHYCLSSCCELFFWDLIRTSGLATCCLMYGMSNLWTKWWRLFLPLFLFLSLLHYGTL